MRRIVDALYRVHNLITAITDINTLLERIMEESKLIVDAEACSLLLYDRLSDELFFHVALGEQGDQAALKSKVRLKLNQGIAGVAASSRTSINVPDVSCDGRFYRDADATTQFTTRCLLAVPLVDHDDLVGVLEVLNKRGGCSFSDTDLHVMEMFSSLAASAIANARLIEDLLRTERLAALGQAVASMSHHTKNIITGMGGSVDLINQGIERQNFEFLKTSWPILKRSIGRIQNFVEDMLAFSKPRQPMCEYVPAQKLVEEVTASFHALLSNRKIDLIVDMTGARLRVYCDSGSLYRALLNLMTNAAEAVPREDGRIRIRGYTSPSNAFVFEIADNGPGISPCDRRRVFEPFFSTKGSQGTGLGLAVTKKIVDEHRGSISTYESENGGAVFQVVIPAGPEQP